MTLSEEFKSIDNVIPSDVEGFSFEQHANLSILGDSTAHYMFQLVPIFAPFVSFCSKMSNDFVVRSRLNLIKSIL